MASDRGLGGLRIARAERVDDLELLRERDRWLAGVRRTPELMPNVLPPQPLQNRPGSGLAAEFTDQTMR